MLPNIRFEYGDVTTLNVDAEFDIVTAARTLQWIADPASAISKMRLATKSSGFLVVLDYNHSCNEWEPDPPSEFKFFYNAFLAWRQINGWDNEMANRLRDLFRSAGLTNVSASSQDEVVERGEPEFVAQAALWGEVIENVGGQFVRAGLITELQLEEGRECYTAWLKTTLRKQTLAMRAVTGWCHRLKRSMRSASRAPLLCAAAGTGAVARSPPRPAQKILRSCISTRTESDVGSPKCR